MTPTGDTTTAFPDLAALRSSPGSPAAIRAAAALLGEQLAAGSHDGESYAANVMHALDALGVAVPEGMAPMISQAVARAWLEPA